MQKSSFPVPSYRSLSVRGRGSLFAGFAGPLPAADITPQQIGQLQKTAADAKSSKDTLQKSLDRAQEQAKALTAKIEKLKADLAAIQAAGAAAEKLLGRHAADVQKYEEEKLRSWSRPPPRRGPARSRGRFTLKAVQDKLRAAQEIDFSDQRPEEQTASGSRCCREKFESQVRNRP